ncbi:hypothetical protein [Streptomyces flaveolus]|uniref:hypothetical protein n=1 Tax=Streptomyces flaveolus TaxID=67297 RepID=UPI0033D74A2B
MRRELPEKPVRELRDSGALRLVTPRELGWAASTLQVCNGSSGQKWTSGADGGLVRRTPAVGVFSGGPGRRKGAAAPRSSLT